MMSLLCVAATLYLAVVLGKGLQQKNSPQVEEQERSDETYSELSKKIDELNRCKSGIDELSDMIADIIACSPDKLHRTVIVSIPENDREYHFLLNGEDQASETLLELFETERDNLNTSLRSRIKKIS